MSAWRREAIARLPELRKMIAAAPSVMYMWNELWWPFRDAYERQPRDEDFIRRVYAYADWCERAPRTRDAGTDPPTAVAVAFYENLPTHPAVREDMPRWFTPEQIAISKGIFAYFMDEKQFAELMQEMQRNVGRYARNRL